MTDVVLALIRQGNRWFLQRRDPGNPVLPGRWEFPGGKVETGEAPEEALSRECQEEVALMLQAAQPWAIVEGPVCLHAFLVTSADRPRTNLAWGWFTAEEMVRLPLPPMNAALLGRLALEGALAPGPMRPV